jgi:hypothetical protein
MLRGVSKRPFDDEDLRDEEGWIEHPHEEDARLISVAPQLLEVLSALLLSIDNIRPPEGGLDGYDELLQMGNRAQVILDNLRDQR